MAILDHIGLNRYIYMTASVDTMLLGSQTITDIQNASSASILGASLGNTRLLLGVNLYNNGPYGFASWQGLRIGENPLTRHMRSSNQYAIEKAPRVLMTNSSGRVESIISRGGIEVYDEPAVVSCYRPLALSGRNNENVLFLKKISANKCRCLVLHDVGIVGCVHSFAITPIAP